MLCLGLCGAAYWQLDAEPSRCLDQLQLRRVMGWGSWSLPGLYSMGSLVRSLASLGPTCREGARLWRFLPWVESGQRCFHVPSPGGLPGAHPGEDPAWGRSLRLQACC